MQRASKRSSQTISSTRTYKLVYYLEVMSLPFGLYILEYLTVLAIQRILPPLRK